MCDSIWTVVKNILGIEKRMFRFDGTKHIYVNKEIENDFIWTLQKYKNTYKNYKLNSDVIKLVKKLQDYCKNKNIKMHIIIMPSHISDIALIYKTGNYDNFEQFKRCLTQISRIYDFQYANIYTTEKINPEMRYFFESSHSTYLLGNKIIDRLTGNDNSFGHILTAENVNEQLKSDKEVLLKYLQENKDFDKWLNTKILEREN